MMIESYRSTRRLTLSNTPRFQESGCMGLTTHAPFAKLEPDELVTMDGALIDIRSALVLRKFFALYSSLAQKPRSSPSVTPASDQPERVLLRVLVACAACGVLARPAERVPSSATCPISSSSAGKLGFAVDGPALFLGRMGHVRSGISCATGSAGTTSSCSGDAAASSPSGGSPPSSRGCRGWGGTCAGVNVRDVRGDDLILSRPTLRCASISLYSVSSSDGPMSESSLAAVGDLFSLVMAKKSWCSCEMQVSSVPWPSLRSSSCCPSPSRRPSTWSIRYRKSSPPPSAGAARGGALLTTSGMSSSPL
mmetsp:Transcript_24843/g.77213  ORF Transcript_24843/g.77213 Transcript_24843/m.77213 type:complete len:308 (-) Transcript_24843:108-1031(-)